MKVRVSLASLMASRDISVSSNPSAPDHVIIKRASFPKGQTPPHLVSFLFRKGDCKGQTGTVIYHGVPVSRTAQCQAERKGGRRVARARARVAAAEA